jgi:hypothetical protein
MDTSQRYYKVLAAMTAGLIIGVVSFGLILLDRRNKMALVELQVKIKNLENAPRPAQLAIVSPLPPSAETKPPAEVQPRLSEVEPQSFPPKPVAAPAPRPERVRPVAVSRLQGDGNAKAIKIATLYKPSQVPVEIGDVRIQTALRTCGKSERRLSLLIKKADDGSMPVLVVGIPAIDEGNATGYAICLESSLPRYGGKVNRVEMVSLSDFREGFATVAQASRAAQRI